jgi:uncharacterized membrane protein
VPFFRTDLCEWYYYDGTRWWPDAVWIAPTLVNSWANYGGSFSPAGYRKDGSGRVTLRGLLNTGTTNTTAFTLPAGYQPAYVEQLLTLSGSGTGFVAINTDGTVVPNYASGQTNIWIELSFVAG